MRDDWRDQSACRGMDGELFFPVGNSAEACAQEEAAKTVCGTCPVRTECLSWALDSGQSSGVWGGLSEFDRLLLGRRARRYASTSDGKHGVQLSIAHRADIRRWVTKEGKTPEEVALLLGVDQSVAVAAVRALNLPAPKPVKVYPSVHKVLEREADLRKLRREGVGLRRCADILEFKYEQVRMAWKVLEKRDAAAAEAAAVAEQVAA